MPRALRTVALAQEHAPCTEILALCEENITVLSTLLRAGVRDYLTPASDRRDIEATLKAQAEKLSQRPAAARNGDDIISFPADQARFRCLHYRRERRLCGLSPGIGSYTASRLRPQRRRSCIPV